MKKEVSINFHNPFLHLVYTWELASNMQTYHIQTYAHMRIPGKQTDGEDVPLID